MDQSPAAPSIDPVAALGVVRASVVGLGPARGPLVEADFRAAGVTALSFRRLHLNESPLPPSPKVIAAIRDAVAGVNLYPDPKVRDVGRVLAARMGVPLERLFFGNGSDELINQIGALCLEPGLSAIVPTPSFPSYGKAIGAQGAQAIAIPVRHDGANDARAMAAAIRGDTRIVLCATPNNPTGWYLAADELRFLAETVPADVLLVIDEAYFEFARHAGAPDVLAALLRTGPWMVLRTLSKAYCLAGLRFGYGIASTPALVEAYNRVRPPFAINRLAQIAAAAALDDEPHTRRLLDTCATERRRLGDGLRALGRTPLGSVANFVCVPVPMTGTEAVQQFAARGILIAAVGPAPFDRHIRITVGTADDTDAVLAALAEDLAPHLGLVRQ